MPHIYPMSYKQQCVRDLAWIITTPMIETDIDVSAWWDLDVAKKLQQLDDDPRPLLHALSHCKSHFLGAYFEVLFSFAIRYLSICTLVLEHQQLLKEGKTFGEIDVLVRDSTGTLHQLEIAIKYYLEVEGRDTQWLGPNKNDSLAKKVARAQQHQLTILQTQIGQNFLQQHQLHNLPLMSHLCIFGYLFYRMDTDSIAIWLHLSEFVAKSHEYTQGYRMQKPHWLCRITDYSNHLLSASDLALQIKQQMNRDDRPVLLSMDKKCVSGVIQEQRVFIVPDHW